ncbi:basal body-orientation factor 1-like [Anneissia japonica]|uniref:basal body-orientation factor 1-like n=1 Tax=Anneissia japonica TaxID=1529436 RepID=UPI001425B5CC|nr:basal body-orientation factor 1-like [Anneissia japonica]
MPKKTKKVKTGKGKVKKGKKKEKKFSDTALATANSKIWEARLATTEMSRQEFRESSKHLALENEALQVSMQKTERDTVEVITFLKREDQAKEDLISKLQKQLKDTKRETRKEKEIIIADFTEKIQQLEDALQEKSNEVKLMQSELKLVKEFRRKRGQMQKELEEIKEDMFLTNKEHKEQLQRMEHKFFEEKIRLQQEASQKIAELAERAHTEAISKLDETTRSVYKENVRVNEALCYHMKETSELEKAKGELVTKNKQLEDCLLYTSKLSGDVLQEKVSSLETALSHMVKEFEREREIVVSKASIETESSKVEIAKLLRTVEMRSKEMNKVKRLAKAVLDQRTEMEQFFLDSLELVKKEIVANRAKYRRDAAMAYHRRMLDAHAGKVDYPKIRTFRNSDTSTNSVYNDLKAAEDWSGLGVQLDLKDLTWEQRERVLRLLFAKMNGNKVRPHPPSDVGPNKTRLSSSIERLAIEGPSEQDKTFLTQAHMDGSMERNIIPAITASAGSIKANIIPDIGASTKDTQQELALVS